MSKENYQKQISILIKLDGNDRLLTREEAAKYLNIGFNLAQWF